MQRLLQEKACAYAKAIGYQAPLRLTGAEGAAISTSRGQVKRREGESFEEFKARRKAEQEETERKCRGVFIPAASISRAVARGELKRRGRAFREQVRQVQEGVKQRVESHRKMGG